MGDRYCPGAVVPVGVVEDAKQSGVDGCGGLDADLAAQDVLDGSGNRPALTDEATREGAADRVGAVLDQEVQLGVCVGGSRYR